MKISMIGCGKLGLPCAEVMSQQYDVIGYDINRQQSNIKFVDTIQEAVENRDIIFVAVPTPHQPAYDGRFPITDLDPKDFDYSIVKHVLTEINKYATKNQLVVLISTVLPGTVRREFITLLANTRFVYNPYLIAMGSVKWDMVNPECLIIGTEDGSLTGDAQILVDFYKKIMENSPPVNIGTWDEAEAIKIFYNTFISAKLSLVNMIQDVAQKNGNINVDVVTNALKNATQRITGPRYLTAGMGDAGACHPRDNIALRWLAKELDLGYDLFHSIMLSRDIQAENKAKFLLDLQQKHNMRVVIHGRAYKPYVEYTDGSYSELIGNYLKKYTDNFCYVDPLTNDAIDDTIPSIFFMAHNAEVTYYQTGVKVEANNLYCDIPGGSIVVDPWRTFKRSDDITVIHYGNTRKK